MPNVSWRRWNSKWPRPPSKRPRYRPSARRVGGGEADQRAEAFQHFAIDLVILDQDAKTFLYFCQQTRDRHRIKFRQRTEQQRLVRERGDTVFADPQHIAQACADGSFDLSVMVWKHCKPRLTAFMVRRDRTCGVRCQGECMAALFPAPSQRGSCDYQGRMVTLDPTPYPIDTLPAHGLPMDVALTDRAGSLDFAGLERLTGQVAAWLASLHLPAGSRVASWLPKTRLACVLPMAVPRAGLVHVPINPLLKRGQVVHILADSNAAAFVTQGPRLSTLENNDIPVACAALLEDDLMLSDNALPPSSASPDTLAAILYTSGSTGRPKGVMLSHANLWFGAVSVAHYLGLDRSDCVLGVLPLSFDYGQNQLFSTWRAGARYAPLDYLTARDVVKAVERYGATTLAGVPPLWVRLIETEWPKTAAATLRRLTNSGGALTLPLIAGLRSRFPAADLFPMYGLTEAFRSTFLRPDLVADHPDSIGHAIPFAEVLVVRPDGAAAQPNEPGELVHAGPLVAQGYWHDPDRTALRFRSAPDFARSGGMAVWSGDTVVADAAGLLHFVGRDDEMIKSAGNRISPTEIEEAVVAGGETTEAVAIGVPDARLGQTIVVVARGDGGREADLRARLRRDLPSFQQPQRYLWRAELPRNANGKLDRAALKTEVTS